MKQQQPFEARRVQVGLKCVVMISVLSALSLSSCSRAATQDASTAPLTVILVRHAEKQIVPSENKDPDLSPEGEVRAGELVQMFGDSGIGAIYASQYKRTQQTVKPLAEKLGISVTLVEAQKTAELVRQIRAQKPGQVVFVAGHNNTVPEIIAALGGPKLPIIPETQYDNLYILTVNNDGSAKLLKLKYGSSKPVMGQRMPGPPQN